MSSVLLLLVFSTPSNRSVPDKEPNVLFFLVLSCWVTSFITSSLSLPPPSPFLSLSSLPLSLSVHTVMRERERERERENFTDRRLVPCSVRHHQLCLFRMNESKQKADRKEPGINRTP
ncbi:hypothetical protein SAY86_026858 [Trapa natans]|uniref:Secreted protein n=1 Tax=Trapa natans TaxID=22666 RepID=A0AAN7QFH7_TRANT|nr:hypothetical protein SAY86_026858 [Trapa natans]